LIVVVIIVKVAIVFVIFVVVALEKEKKTSSCAKELKNRYLTGAELRSKLTTDFVLRYWYVEPKNQFLML
jgi:hypothetical protein